jgi:hypothetical protein
LLLFLLPGKNPNGDMMVLVVVLAGAAGVPVVKKSV